MTTEVSKKQEIEETLNILKEADKRIEFRSQRDFILVLGDIASGKTTLTQFIAGDNNKLESIDEGAGEFHILDTDNKINNITIHSEKKFPKLVIDADSNGTFYDCPGFENRDSYIDIANAFLIKRIIDESINIKILLTIDYHSVKKISDRDGFMKLMKHTTNIIKNIDKISKSIALVVTQVDNSYRKQGNNMVLIESDVVLNNIASFLNSLKEQLEKEIQGQNLEEKIFFNNTIKLINIFLLKENSVKYTRLSLFRKPDQSGPISEIELLQKCKNDIKEVIYNNIEYSPKTDHDFGFTISEKSVNFITQLTEEINKSITENVEKVCENIVEGLNVEQEQYSGLVLLQTRFKKLFETLKELIISFNKDTTIDELYNGIISFIDQLILKINKEYLKNILTYQNIFDICYSLVDKTKINYRTLNWIKPLEMLLKHFEEFFNWYTFLIFLYDELSDDHVRLLTDEDEVIKTKNLLLESLNQNHSNTENLLTQLLSSINLNYLTKLENIKNINLDKTKIEYLAKIVETTLEQTFTISNPKTGVLEVKGNFVKISDISDEYLKDIKFLNIFALNTVYIDKDITCIGQQLQLSIIAYKWKIVQNVQINLNGKPGDQQSDASPGNNGQPGLPGGNAGHFLGICKINDNQRNLVILANGGIGGTGQNGGVGLPGTDGKNAFLPSGRDPLSSTKLDFCGLSNNELEKHNIHRSKGWFKDYYSEDYFYIHGKSGNPGQQGGNGGKGGNGGNEGNVCIISFDLNYHNFEITNHNYGEGNYGIGGKGGCGGKNGTRILAKINRDTNENWCQVSETPGEVKPSGNMGVDNFNEIGKILPHKNYPNFPYSINRFRKFLNENLIENIDKMLLIEFLNLINNEERNRKLYNTMSIIEEMQDLEKQRQEFKDGIDFIPSYRSLLEKIIEYANTINIQTDNNFLEEKKVLALLYAAVLSAICRLNQSLESDLIIDLEKFIKMACKNVKKIQTINNNAAIKDFYQNYKDGLEHKIEEANLLISNKITPEIDNIITRVDNKLLHLVKEIEEIKRRTHYEKQLLQSLQEKLREQVKTRKILGFLKVASQFLNFAGPYGAQASYSATVGLQIYENISLGPEISIEKNQTTPIPPGAINTIEKIGKQIMEEIVIFDFQLTDILEHLKKSSDETLKNLSDEITDAQETMKTVFDKNLGTIYKGIDNIKTIIDKSKKWIESYDTDEIRIDLKPIMTTIENIEKILSIGELSLDIYSKIRHEEGKVDELSAIIRGEDDKLRELKNYESCIFNIVVPVFENVQKNVKKYQNNLGSQSHAVLDVAKWQIQKSLSNLKQLMLDITNGFIIQNDLAHIIEKLMESMSMLIDLYNHIENYHDQQKFAKYIANIASVDSSQMSLQNSELNEAIAVLDKTIKYNILLDQYERALNSFKQYIFPFAKFHLEEFYISWSKNDSITSLVEKAAENLGKLQDKLTESQVSISRQYDTFISSGKFNNANESFKSFYEWKNSTHHDLISDLLEEKEVIFVADILKSINKNAIKFNVVQLDFKVSNESLQKELNEALKEYEIRMTHMGRSNYRYGKKFYFITHDKQTIQYSYSENNDEPATRNMVYNKIKKGNFLLSPYTMWTIKLIKRNNFDDAFLQTNSNTSVGATIKKLVRFKNEIDLYLVGHGQCVTKDFEESEENLEKYYKLYN